MAGEEIGVKKYVVRLSAEERALIRSISKRTHPLFEEYLGGRGLAGTPPPVPAALRIARVFDEVVADGTPRYDRPAVPEHEREALLRYLASKLYAGRGAHGLFMKTWAAGLAYSNGIRGSAEAGRVGYYAERCPDLAQTLGFVTEQLDRAKPDPALVEYALALAFDDGCELFVGTDPQFESWHLSGHGVDDILVGPGGHSDWQQPD